MDRRRFLYTAAGAAGSLAASRLLNASSAGKSRITFVRDAQAVHGGNADPDRVSTLLDRLIRIHYDVADPVDAFRQRFSSHDRIGIKVNCLAGRRMSTHVELVDAIVKNLLKADIPAKNIIIWERLNIDLRGGGFEIKPVGREVACAGCDVLGYDSHLTVHRSIGSLFAKPVTTLCTAQINVPVLKDHGIVGVTLGMKNMFGAIHNPNKYHHNLGDPYVADLYSHPSIGGSIRMTIIDALEAQCNGGPPYQPTWAKDYGGLLLSEDPVALDRYGWEMIEEMRREKGLPSLQEAGREPTYIHTAAQLGLGTDDLDKIDVRQN
jgi:uncharacterized protein (DUF362 family)